MRDFDETKALQDLNRITGLEFESFPESLVNPKVQSDSDLRDRISESASRFYRLNV